MKIITLLFSVQDDIALGRQVSEEISKDPSIRFSSEKFPFVYEYLYAMREEILTSVELAYADEFEWSIHVIDNTQVQNASVLRQIAAYSSQSRKSN
jgi:beta-barrel assembly-enhancing protease